MECIVKFDKNNKVVIDNLQNAQQDYVYIVPLEYKTNNDFNKFLNMIVDDFISRFIDSFGNLYWFEIHTPSSTSRAIKIFKRKSELIQITFSIHNNSNIIYNVTTAINFKPSFRIKETNKIYMYVVLFKEQVLKQYTYFCKILKKGKNTYLLDLTKHY